MAVFYVIIIKHQYPLPYNFLISVLYGAVISLASLNTCSVSLQSKENNIPIPMIQQMQRCNIASIKII